MLSQDGETVILRTPKCPFCNSTNVLTMYGFDETHIRCKDCSMMTLCDVGKVYTLSKYSTMIEIHSNSNITNLEENDIMKKIRSMNLTDEYYPGINT